MINPLRFFTRQEYFFRPSQAWRRMQKLWVGSLPETAEVELPWGALVQVRPAEVIGAQIWYYGIFDLIVAEAIVRLFEPGETALDIGANIGQMTSLMRNLAGPQGRVLSFEPHPGLFAALERNCANAPAKDAPVKLHRLGLSDRAGEAFLTFDASWELNQGKANVATTPVPGRANLPVQLARLDELVPAAGRVGVCKVDVEGHEPAVFRGAGGLLTQGNVRDILFEDLAGLPSENSALLAAAGYTIFALRQDFWGPSLRDSTAPASAGNYLATREPERAVHRFAQRGWRALRGPP